MNKPLHCFRLDNSCQRFLLTSSVTATIKQRARDDHVSSVNRQSVGGIGTNRAAGDGLRDFFAKHALIDTVAEEYKEHCQQGVNNHDRVHGRSWLDPPLVLKMVHVAVVE